MRRRYQIEPSIRVGVHSGTVVVTGLTSGRVDAADIVGSAANIAARLQAEAEAGTLVISDATRQLVEPHFVMEPAGERLLRGIARPMGVFRVLATGCRRGAIRTRGLTDSIPFIGREHETSVLRQTWERAVASCADRQVATDVVGVIRGPAGIGKSRMAAELCEEVRAEGGAVFEAHCSPYHANVALWPIGRMLEQLLGSLSGAVPGGSAGRDRATPRGCRPRSGRHAVPTWRRSSACDLDRPLTTPQVDALALAGRDPSDPGGLARSGGQDADPA